MTPTELEIVQMLCLDKWTPARINHKISNHFGLTVPQVCYLRKKPEFKAEYAKQLRIYQGNFGDIQLADRKERVLALAGLYEKVPELRVALKVKVLKAIRAEMGDDRPIQVEHHHQGAIGLNLPPRAAPYKEWVAQNRMAREAEGEEVEPEAQVG